MSPLFRLRRERSVSPDIWLPLKVALFIAGAAAALAGMALRQDWLVTAAIVLLGIGILLRFVRPSDAEPPRSELPPRDPPPED